MPCTPTPASVPGQLILQPWSATIQEIMSFSVPQLSTAERDNLTNPPNGMIIYNRTTGTFQVRQAGSWASLFDLAPDGVAPSDPTAIAVRQAGARIVEIDLTFTEPSDWSIVELYRNTSDNSGTASLVAIGRTKRFHDQNVAYGTTYYYWGKVVDYGGEKSGFSPSANHSITVAKITTADLAAGAITTTEITDSAITTPKLAANAVTAAKIAAGTITTNEIAADTILAGNIAAGAIGTSELAALSVTAAKIAAGTITATEIAALTITAGIIAADAIITSKVQADAITSVGSFENDASVNISTTTWTDVASVTVTTVGTEAMLWWAGRYTTNTGYTMQLQVIRDSTVVAGPYSLPEASGGSQGTSTVELDTPADGTYTYKVQALASPADGNGGTVSYRRFILLVRKK